MEHAGNVSEGVNSRGYDKEHGMSGRCLDTHESHSGLDGSPARPV